MLAPVADPAPLSAAVACAQVMVPLELAAAAGGALLQVIVTVFVVVQLTASVAVTVNEPQAVTVTELPVWPFDQAYA